MAIGLAESIRNNRLNVIRDAIDAGVGAGVVKFYTGIRPATGQPITDQVLLGTLIFSDPCAPNAASATLSFSAIAQDSQADATGTATWARVEDSAAGFVMDLSVTATGGGGDIELNTTSIVAGGPITITSAVLTESNA